jgi:hypothetical protein
MALGLSKEELENIFQEELVSTHNQLKTEQNRKVADLVARGHSETAAGIQTFYENRMLCCSGALLAVVTANNRKIELQLKEKGIQI